MNSKPINMDKKNNTLYLQTFNTFVKGETNKVLHETCVEDRHLVVGFENARADGRIFERVGSQNFLGNRQFSLETPETSSTCF